jgi:2-iminobutanoate/2-iminopropanoate deaminase
MKEKLEPQSIHKPVGSYSHVMKVSAKELVFVAGQVPVDKDGNVVGVNPNDKIRNHQTIDLAAQLRQTFLNVKSALEEAGATVKDIVRLDTYMVATAMNEYRTVGIKVRNEMLGQAHPPGATVFITGLMIPEALVEISAVAAIE